MAVKQLNQKSARLRLVASMAARDAPGGAAPVRPQPQP